MRDLSWAAVSQSLKRRSRVSVTGDSPDGHCNIAAEFDTPEKAVVARLRRRSKPDRSLIFIARLELTGIWTGGGRWFASLAKP